MTRPNDTAWTRETAFFRIIIYLKVHAEGKPEDFGIMAEKGFVRTTLGNLSPDQKESRRINISSVALRNRGLSEPSSSVSSLPRYLFDFVRLYLRIIIVFTSTLFVPIVKYLLLSSYAPVSLRILDNPRSFAGVTRFVRLCLDCF
jgi:hypothetical protein